MPYIAAMNRTDGKISTYIVGKQLLKANRKKYIVDLGLRNHILPFRIAAWFYKKSGSYVCEGRDSAVLLRSSLFFASENEMSYKMARVNQTALYRH